MSNRAKSLPESSPWHQAAEQGDALAQFQLGLAYHFQDPAAAARWFRLAAIQGFADAQVQLGLAYFDGRGVAPDYSAAVSWWRLAADQGNAEAQTQLGWAYFNGLAALRKNQSEAVRLYSLAAQQGRVIAQYHLGLAHRDGFGTPQDFVMALMWLNIAAAHGDDFALGVRENIAMEARDELANRMTAAQIAEAQRLAREWWAARLNQNRQ